MTAIAILEAYRDAGVPDGVFNLVMGPGDTVGDELQDEPGHRRHRLHRLLRGRLRPLPQLLADATRGRASWRWAARTRRSCMAQRGPRGGGRGHHARGVRLRRPEVLGQQPRLRRARRSTTSSSGSLVEKTEKLVVGDPLPRAAFLGPVIDQRAVDRHQQAVAEARRDGTVFTGGEHLTDGDLARGFYVEPTVVGLPASHRLFQDELFAPFTAVARRGLARRGARASPTTTSTASPPASTARTRPRSSASSRRSRRASCTSTGAPAPRPAPGRASRRSAAGRAPAPPASPACRCTTSRSSCASRATPSSTDAPPPQPGSGPRLRPGARRCPGQTPSRRAHATTSSVCAIAPPATGHDRAAGCAARWPARSTDRRRRRDVPPAASVLPAPTSRRRRRGTGGMVVGPTCRPSRPGREMRYARAGVTRS